MRVSQTRTRLTVPLSTILVIAGAAMALMLLGIFLRSRPADLAGEIGDFIPGWPWW